MSDSMTLPSAFLSTPPSTLGIRIIGYTLAFIFALGGVAAGFAAYEVNTMPELNAAHPVAWSVAHGAILAPCVAMIIALMRAFGAVGTGRTAHRSLCMVVAMGSLGAVLALGVPVGWSIANPGPGHLLLTGLFITIALVYSWFALAARWADRSFGGGRAGGSAQVGKVAHHGVRPVVA